MEDRCRFCGVPVCGTDTCNHCQAHIDGDITPYGCHYLGNDLWDCGWRDHADEALDALDKEFAERG